MALFRKESLELLRERVDLVEVVSSHVEMKPAGASYKGCCPFHEEKSPSFMIRRGDSHYHCFGCGAHGDAIEFLMQHLSLTFTEAVEQLAAKFGVVLQVQEEGENRGPNKGRLKEVVAAAHQFYTYSLLHTDGGKRALAYLAGRGMDLRFVNRFELGFTDGRGLVQAIEKQGVKRYEMSEVGLLSQAGREFFFDRILFPIRDNTGAVIGFSGRRFKEGSGGGKYINTPETPLFNKSRTLFGLSDCRRRIAKEKRAVIVEGQVDALRMIDAGVDITVAALGTAFGAGHVKLLVDLGVTKVYLAFDSDRAGRAAATKVGDLFSRVGVEVVVAMLPEGADPDSLLQAEGPQALFQILREGTDYLSFLVSGRDVRTPAAKAQLVDELGKQIRNWENPVMVHESLRRLAHLTDLPPETVGAGEVALEQIQVPKEGYLAGGAVDPNRVMEADVLRWLLLLIDEKPEVAALAKKYLNADAFWVPACQKIFAAYLEVIDDPDKHDMLSVAISVEDEEGQLVLSEVLQKRVNKERAEELFPGAILRILERNWMAARESLAKKMQEVDEEGMLELAKQFDQLKKNRPTVAL